jgi:hypothetical protein
VKEDMMGLHELEVAAFVAVEAAIRSREKELVESGDAIVSPDGEVACHGGDRELDALYGCLQAICETSGSGHRWVSNDWFSTESGGMGATCERCHYSWRHPLY